MWYNNRLYRLLGVVAIYLLGALGAAILRVRADAIRTRVTLPLSNQMLEVFSSWLLVAAWLPMGTLYYLGGWVGWFLGGLAYEGLIILATWILVARSHAALVLRYSVFIILVVVLARGCAYAKIP